MKANTSSCVSELTLSPSPGLCSSAGAFPLPSGSFPLFADQYHQQTNILLSPILRKQKSGLKAIQLTFPPSSYHVFLGVRKTTEKNCPSSLALSTFLPPTLLIRLWFLLLPKQILRTILVNITQKNDMLSNPMMNSWDLLLNS